MSISVAGPAVSPAEFIARLVFSPTAWNIDTGLLIWNQLVSVYGAGLSFFRDGCTITELRDQIDRVVAEATVPQQLVGATVTTGGSVRAIGNPTKYFCLYDTDAPEFLRHADLLGRWPEAPSNTQREKARQLRMKALRDELQTKVVFAATADALADALRGQGFTVAE